MGHFSKILVHGGLATGLTMFFITFASLYVGEGVRSVGGEIATPITCIITGQLISTSAQFFSSTSFSPETKLRLL